jgi:hypothetical protein
MITIVSGLPRSGTSMMMQMLEAGGVPILMDTLRPADEHNLRGYYELQKVKALKKDNSWVADAEGKALKVVSLLLYDLPSHLEYKVLFMRRDLEEVLRSQEKMLSGLGAPAGAAREAMRTHFVRHLQQLEEWLKKQAHIQVLDCPFKNLVERPADTIEEIAKFLGRELNRNAMAAIADPALHRQKI